MLPFIERCVTVGAHGAGEAEWQRLASGRCRCYEGPGEPCAPRGVRHSLGGPQRNGTGRDRWPILCRGSLFLAILQNDCKGITEPSQPCSVPDIPSRPGRKRLSEGSD